MYYKIHSIYTKQTTQLYMLNKKQTKQSLEDKPFYCQDEMITSFCSYCGCPEGEICNLKTNVCVKAIAVESIEVLKDFLNLDTSEVSIVEDVLWEVTSIDKAPVVPEVDYIPEESELKVSLDEESSLVLSFDENGFPRLSLDIIS